MLKKFFLNALSSFVGAWVALLLLAIVGFIAIVGMVSRVGAGILASETVSVSKHSVLTLDLSGAIEEVESAGKPDLSDVAGGNFNRPQSLSVIVRGLAEGKVNKNVEALRINCGGVAAAPATLNAIREAVMDFKKSGKKVYAYGDSYSMGDLFVASVADSLFVNPSGEVSINGIGGTSLYMKDFFDKIGVTFQVVKVGTFKSAVEPYISNEMSAPARAQLDTLYNSMWNYICSRLAESRKGLTVEKINALIDRDNISWAPVSEAVGNGLVDKAVYGRVFDSIIGRLVGKSADEVNYVSCSDLVGQTDWGQEYNAGKQVAVLYACGSIADGNPREIDFNTLVPVIVKLADDDRIKGMVLRVNSPGGSAYGSDQIGEALDYFKSKGKKLAVSMGDYAASGGYWISCGADVIFADPLTITGSIGIFGLFPNASRLASMLGVSPQNVYTNPSAAFPSIFNQMSPEQTEVLQRYVERGYDTFIARVAKGRKIKEGAVRRIAEGRVWDAMTAKKIHLVDSIGGLDKAIDWVTAKVNDGELAVSIYPRREASIWDFIPASTSLALQQAVADLSGHNVAPEVVDRVREVLWRRPVQARMPEINVSL